MPQKSRLNRELLLMNERHYTLIINDHNIKKVVILNGYYKSEPRKIAGLFNDKKIASMG